MVKTAVRSYITEDRKGQRRSHVEMHTHISREHKNNLVKTQVIYSEPKAKSMCQLKKKERDSANRVFTT